MDSTAESAAPAPGDPAGVVSPDQLRALYSGPPGEFVAGRKALAASVRAAGEKEAARRVAAFRKPTTAAWVINLLAVDGRTAPELLELAGEIVAAVSAGEGTELRTLAAAQRILVTEILERASALASGVGVRIPAAAVEAADGAIRGVLADPSTMDQLFTGVLVELPGPEDDALPELAFRTAVSPAGNPARKAAPRSEIRPPASRTPASRTSQEQRGSEPSRPAAVDRTRHLRAVRDAGAALRAAERLRNRREGSVRDLEGERERLVRALEDLERRVAGARDELETADRELESARRTREALEGTDDD